MKIWSLDHIGLTTSCGEAYGMVVVAGDEAQARRLAAGDVEHSKWLNPTRTTCVEVCLDVESVILVANAGGD